MNETSNSVPSLLSLTAPAVPARRDAVRDDGFANQLDAAAASSPTSEPRRPKSAEESKSSGEADRDEKPVTDASAETIEPEVAGSSEEGGSERVEENLDGSEETILLSVTAATETLVVETPPTAVLPQEAATTIDVGFGEIESTANPSSLTDDGATKPSPTNGSPIDQADLADNKGGTPGLTGSSEAAAIQGIPSTTESPELGIVIETLEQAADKPIGDAAAQAASAVVPAQAESQEETPVAQPDQLASATATKLADAAETGDARSDPRGETNGEGTESAAGVDGQNAKAPPQHPQPVVAATSVAAAAASDQPDSAEQPESITAAGNTHEPTDQRTQPDRVGQAEPRTTVDAARFVSRVAGAINSANERGGPIEIRLSPPELGALRVSIEVKEGVLTAQLEAETPAARTTLLDNLPALRDRLEQQQIRIDKFDVDVRDDSQQSGGDWQAPDRDPQGSSERSERREPVAERPKPTPKAEATSDAAPTGSTITFDNNGINLVA